MFRARLIEETALNFIRFFKANEVNSRTEWKNNMPCKLWRDFVCHSKLTIRTMYDYSKRESLWWFELEGY